MELFASVYELSDELEAVAGRPSIVAIVGYERNTSPLRPVVYATIDVKDFDPETHEQEVLWLETSCAYRRQGYATELLETLVASGWNLRMVPGSDVGADFIDFLEAKHSDWFH